ncbi:MAG: hydantoinase B/oxoprolinase family protein [Promethearchaeota archaeon]
MKDNKIDPIITSVIMNRMDTIAKQMATTVLKTSRSAVFNQAHDFSCGLADGKGRMISMEAGLPIHLGAMPFGVKYVIDYFKDDLYPGDVIMMNSPYHGNNHPADVTIITPIFWEEKDNEEPEKPIAFAITRGHQADIGGNQAGTYNPMATELMQEAFVIPPSKLYHNGGKLNKSLWDLFLTNVRVPHYQSGDLLAQIGGNRIAERRILETVQEFSLKMFENTINKIIDSTEKRIRAELETWPDGTYKAESLCEGDFTDPGPYNIKVSLTVKGSDLIFDFSGSYRQVKAIVNSAISNTYSAVYTSVLTSVDPEIPHNEGCFKPINIIAPKGTIVNVEWPYPTGMSTVCIAQEIIHACWKAIAQAVPEKANAEWGKWNTMVTNGIDRYGRRYTIIHYINLAGGGATWGADGWPHVASSMALGAAIPMSVELLESKFPELINMTNFVIDSGGPGKWRGGVGMKYEIEPYGDKVEYVKGGCGQIFPPEGLLGGKEGSICRHWKGPKGKIKYGRALEVGYAKEGRVFGIEMSGGAGIGNPLERDPELVRWDVLNEYVSLESAEKDYGVIIDPNKMEIDYIKTKRLREQLKNK